MKAINQYKIEKFKNRVNSFFDYSILYIQNTFLKLIGLFVSIFLVYGFYIQNFFVENFLVFVGLLGVTFYFVRSLLYRRARVEKIVIIGLVCLISVYASENYAVGIFQNTGLENFKINLTDAQLSEQSTQTISTISSQLNYQPDLRKIAQLTYQKINVARPNPLVWND